VSHFLTVPINENGIIFDQNIDTELNWAASAPFAFTDVFIYSHGWWNTASSAVSEYNIFSIGFSQVLQRLCGATPKDFPSFGNLFSPLALAVHWPSMISEDQKSVVNFLEATSFFTMEHRADGVGSNGGYSLLRLLIEARAGKAPLRFNLIGHSFGCRVVLSALQALAKDPGTLAKVKAMQTQFNVVLLQAAADTDSLASGRLYGDVLKSVPNLRILATVSANDKALGTWYPAAQKLAHLFSDPIAAMGTAGPTGALSIPVDQKVSVSPGSAPTFTGKLGVADLTPLHQSRVAMPGVSDNFGGQHSDINLPEIYETIVRFFGA
jgi:hypothetical protein